MSWVEDAKRRAVLKAIEPIKSGWIIGLGSGSTTAYAVPELARLMKLGRVDVSIVPASHQIEHLAIKHGLRIITMNEAYTIDYAIDGADQVEEGTLNLIKGGGGAHLREKIIEKAARKFAVVIHETKLSKWLGGKQTVPLEVLPFAYRYVQAQITKMMGRAKLREANGKMGPVVTDNGNFILDADFGKIRNPRQLDVQLSKIPGLLETGLFIGMADAAYVGLKTGDVKVMDPKHG